jgi:type I restriction enzyme, S subunit
MNAEWDRRSFESCIEPVVYTQKIQRKDFLDSGKYPIISQEAEFVNGYWDKDADVFKVSRPVVLFGDHTQVFKYVDFDFVLGADGVKILQSKSFLCPKFFFYQLQAAEFPSLGYARHYRLLKETEISFPPLPEQQRIVALLDEAYAGLATAKANAEGSLQNARAIFESHLQTVFSQRGEGWVEMRIEEWCDSVMDCVNKTAPVVEGPTPFKMIRTTNVRNGRVDVSTVKFVTEEIFKIWTRRQIPQKGDVILTREAPMGEVGMLLTNDKVFLGQRLVSYRVNSEKLDNQFLLFALQSGDLQDQIHAKASGSTVQHMRVPDTKNLFLAAPPLTTQRNVVEHLISLREETQHLIRLYERKLAALEELKKSLLHQAFNGEL